MQIEVEIHIGNCAGNAQIFGVFNGGEGFVQALAKRIFEKG